MADPRKSLSSKFQAGQRFTNFGSLLTRVKIDGFRGIKTEIDFEYPVTALSGFNGSGKSTVGQLLLCGYKKLSTSVSAKRYYVVNFFPVSLVDPKPFTDDAQITYSYQTDKPGVMQDLTVSRATSEWSGYKRQPERNTEYVGFTVYIPKVERRDLSVYNAKNMTLGSRTDLEGAAVIASRILGSPYDEIYFQGVQAHKKQGDLGIARRFGTTYSENNMGFGEGRVVYTVRLLETCPAQSLVILEEPETSLHESAQYELSKYLLDVSDRRGHQIVFSIHSSTMMNALPPEGRKLLIRKNDGVKVYNRVSASRIRTALSAGEHGHCVICVEDDFAQSLLREILQRFDKTLLSSVSVLPFGDTKAVKAAKEALENSGVHAIAVRDADKGESKLENLFKFPGSQPPEKDVFLNNSVQSCLSSTYGIDFQSIISAKPDLNHHKYAEHCCDKAHVSREVLETDCIRAFLDDVGPSWYTGLCEQIQSATQK